MAVTLAALVTATTAVAFTGANHTSITRTALKSVSINGHVMARRLRDRIVYWNNETDSLVGSRACTGIWRAGCMPFYDARRHFDAHEINSATAHLLGLHIEVIDALDRGVLPVRQIGQILHGLQDFYSHSNWQHMVSRGDFAGRSFCSSGADKCICPDLTRRLAGSTGAVIRQAPMFFGTEGERRNPRFCNIKDRTGPWDAWEPAATSPSGLITSTFFAFTGESHVPPRACLHTNGTNWGSDRDQVCIKYNGDFYCHHEYTAWNSEFNLERKMAIEASADYIRRLVTRYGSQPGTLSVLAGTKVKKSALALVLDVSSGMGPSVQAWANRLAQVPTERGLEAETYYLLPFADTVGNVEKFDTIAAFATRVGQLTLRNEVDCPDPWPAALLTVAKQMPRFGDIHLVTDSEAPGGAASALGKLFATLLIKQKKLHLSTHTVGKCTTPPPPSGKKARDVSDDVGGVHFGGTFVDGLPIPLRPEEPIRTVKLDVYGGILGGQLERLVDVDDAIADVEFLANVEQLEGVTLYRPGGEIVTAADEDTTVRETEEGQLIQVAGPVAGQWRLVVDGTGDALVQARGASERDVTLELVLPAGRPAHPYFRPLHSAPPRYSGAWLEARSSEDLQSASFTLVTPTGEEITEVDLVLQPAEDLDDDAADGDDPEDPEDGAPWFYPPLDTDLRPVAESYFGLIDSLPDGPFRVRFEGETEEGSHFVRMMDELHETQPYVLDYVDGERAIAPDETAQFIVDIVPVDILDPGTELHVEATSSAEGEIAVSPSTVTFVSSVPTPVTVTFTAPAELAHGATFDLSVGVSEAGGHAGNVLTWQMTVLDNELPVADPGPAIVVTAEEGTALVALDGSGSYDPDGLVESFHWYGLDESVDPADEVQPTVELPVGEHVLYLYVVDDQGEPSEVAVLDVTVNPPATGPCEGFEAEPEYQLSVSCHPDRSDAVPLAGAVVTCLPLYVFAEADEEVRRIEFWIDRDAEGRPDSRDRRGPFDLGGGGKRARPSLLADGPHHILERIEFSAGDFIETCTEFEVAAVELCDSDPETEAAYPMRYSLSEDRGDPQPLDDATIAEDLVYPFLDPVDAVSRVEFYTALADGSVTRRRDRRAPYDLRGGNARKAKALELVEGTYAIHARIRDPEGIERLSCTRFEQGP